MFAQNNYNKSVFANTLRTVNLATGLPRGYAGAGVSYGTSFVTYGILAGGSGSGSGSGGTGIDGGDSSFAYVILLKYSELAKVVRTINNLLYQYSLGNFEYVVNNFTSVIYYNLSQDLYKLREDANVYPDYETMRQNVVRGLEGLYKSVNLYKDYMSQQLKLEAQTEKARILDDMNKLREYIRGLSGSLSLFPDMYVTSIAATLKPEIAIYIQLYGFPDGGVFEADKLAFALSLVPEDQLQNDENEVGDGDLVSDPSGNDVSGNDVSGNDVSGNNVSDSDLTY